MGDFDLPLSANIDEILVNKFEFDLKFDLEGLTLTGSVLLWFSPVIYSDNCKCSKDKHFELILDCCDLTVARVYSKNQKLNFQVEEHFIQIWHPDIFCAHDFPSQLTIDYCTSGYGNRSLKWSENCVFTAASPFNNRALFPCQDSPLAAVVWCGKVTVPIGYTVLTTSDLEPKLCTNGQNVTFGMSSKLEHPICCFALAVGKWEELSVLCEKHRWLCPILPFLSEVKVKIYSEQRWVENLEKISKYLKNAIKVVEKYFGSFPFRKLHVLVTPECFGALGLMSPSLMFLSPSVIQSPAEDHSMLIRISHELIHSWFGIMIGLEDWREDWISEGFATFLEDVIHCEVIGLKETGRKEWLEIRKLVKLGKLKAEMENMPKEMLKLRSLTSSSQSIEDGKNPQKLFRHVHYLKGYFLVDYLYSMMGDVVFHQFLRQFIIQFFGTLICSEDILELIYSKFGHNLINQNRLAADWLDFDVLPSYCKNLKFEDNNLVDQVHYALSCWKKRQKCRKRKRCIAETSAQLEFNSDQLILFLSLLLKWDTVSISTLRKIFNLYNISEQNAEVTHYWLELVIKHNMSEHFESLKNYLINHQSLGVYLYGEMMIFGRKKLQSLAREIFEIVKERLDWEAKIIVENMISPHRM